MRSMRSVALAVLAGLLASSLFISALLSKPRERTFEITYVAEVARIPQDAGRIDIWLPYPQSDPNQRVRDVRVSSAYPTSVGEEPEFGNAVLHVAASPPAEKPIRVEMTFQVTRQEHRNKPSGPGSRSRGVEPDAKRWLEPDQLVPIDDRIRKLSEEVTRRRKTDLEKARAIYDYVVATMAYDKSGTGWGRGDLAYACDVRKGNCTDFHALFVGLARAAGIPAKFAIGFPLPEERGAGRIGGYHCWAEFYVEGHGWVPVDASEAKKHPEKREYFFGAHDENRVQLTVGRDIVLEPRQAGEPLNYFIYPYVEIDGKPFSEVGKEFSFRDLGGRRSERSTSS